MIKAEPFKQGDAIAAHNLPFDDALRRAGMTEEQIARIREAQKEEEHEERLMTLEEAQAAIEQILDRLRPESHEIKINYVRGDAYEMEVHMNIPIGSEVEE